MDEQQARRSHDGRRARADRRSGIDTRTDEQKQLQGERRSGKRPAFGRGASREAQNLAC